MNDLILSMLKRILSLLPVLLLFAALSAPSDAVAGPRMKKLKQDVKRIKAGKVLVMPVLPDRFVEEKLRKKSDGEARIEAYHEAIRKANLYLREAVRAHFTFCPVVFPEAESEHWDWPDYRAWLESEGSDSVFVLQFGHAAQFCGPEPKRIKRYDRDFIGIYEADGQSRMIINSGEVSRFVSVDYAGKIIRNFQQDLDRYYKKATRPPFRLFGKKKKD